MKCAFCGAELKDGAKFCLVCGSSMPVAGQNPVSLDKNNAGGSTNNTSYSQNPAGSYSSGDMYSQNRPNPYAPPSNNNTTAFSQGQNNSPYSQPGSNTAYAQPNNSIPAYAQPNNSIPAYAQPNNNIPAYAQPAPTNNRQYSPAYNQSGQQENILPAYSRPNTALPANQQYMTFSPAEEREYSNILAFGIAGLACSVTFIFSVVGLVFGILGLVKSNNHVRTYGYYRSGKVRTGHGLAMGGTIVGAIFLTIFLIFLAEEF